MRLAVVAAFPFPLAQGSQIFVAEQVRALAAAGARVTLFCYGSGEGEPPEGLEIVRVPRRLSPRSLRAGPGLGKPLADAALAQRLRIIPKLHFYKGISAVKMWGEGRPQDFDRNFFPFPFRLVSQ